MPESQAGKPKVGLLLGDPSGIGPELVAKLLADANRDRSVDLIVIGDERVLQRNLNELGLRLDLQIGRDLAAFDYAAAAIPFLQAPVTRIDLAAMPFGAANDIGGRYAMENLTFALDLAVAKKIDAVAYAPMNKKAMNLAGWKYRDGVDFCTSHLAYEGPFSELNVLENLWVARVTSHVPMKDVSALLTPDKVHSIIALLNGALTANGVEAPRIAVAGYNPHCGEGGLCGTEEIDAIVPAIELANAGGMRVEGPLPADIVYIEAQKRGFDGIVAMYHDQCQIANKLLEFERGIAIHGGSPVPTVTTGHGTAYDIVGKGLGNPNPLKRAVSVAANIARNRDMYAAR